MTLVEAVESVFRKNSHAVLIAVGLFVCVAFSTASIFVPIRAISSILALVAGLGLAFSLYPAVSRIQEWKEKKRPSAVRLAISFMSVCAVATIAYLAINAFNLPMQIGATAVFATLALFAPYALPTDSEMENSLDDDSTDAFFDGVLEGAGVTKIVRKSQERNVADVNGEDER